MHETTNLEQFREFLRQVSESSFQVIYITSDLARLGFAKRTQHPRVIAQKIADLIKDQLSCKTVIFPTATLGFGQTNETFYARDTPSQQMGVLNELLRRDHATFRSCHPLWSHGGFGELSKEILDKTSKNAYGLDSIWDRLKGRNAMVMNLGVDIKNSMTLVHHIEQIIGVPYRYPKVFFKTVADYHGNLFDWHFTINVIRNDLIIERDRNVGLCNGFEPYLIQNRFSDLQTYDYEAFYHHLIKKFCEDMFCWVRNPIQVKEQCLNLSF